MEAVVDSGGRVMLPKQLRESLGLVPGATVDVSPYGSGVQITLGGRTARLEHESDDRLVASSETVVTDEMLYAAIDAGRR